MGFHPHFANCVLDLFRESGSKEVAILGDQEAFDNEGRSWPLVQRLAELRAARFTVFEHPGQRSRINDMANWVMLDLSEAKPNHFRHFDLVIDGGTLEHVGNMAAAISAIWTGLQPGGHFVGGYPVNNLCDHGYWLPQPRFFADFFRINGADSIDIKIVRWMPMGASVEFEILQYARGSTGKMYQPEWAMSTERIGVFVVARKQRYAPIAAEVKMPCEFE